MKPKHAAERLGTDKSSLKVYVRVEVGLTHRWIMVRVPWGMVADHHREITEHLERLYTSQLEADANVQYLPLEKWE